MKRKLIIISNDAMVYEDLSYLRTKPSIRPLLENGSLVKTLRSVYPTITYCCHASMITGCYPAKTHVYNNEVDELGNSSWNWERRRIRVKTLLDAAKEAGCTTANVFWPVLGQDDNIDYNIPEYWSQTPDEPLTVALERMGTSRAVIEEIVKPNLYYIEGHQRMHPYADEFIFACARDMIVKYRPDVMVLHPAGIDGLRHRYGIFNDYVTEQLDYTYYWIEKLVRALKEVGEYENTDIVITSDHGQMDIKRWGHPNVLLAQNGFMTVKDGGRPENVKAYAKPVGGSAQIFLVDRSPETYAAVYRLFADAARTGMYGFERCYTREEAAREEGLDGDFAFVLESDGYSAFGENASGPYFTGYELSDYRMGRGTHGYLPDKGPQPCMILSGPDFKKGIQIERRSTLDMAATLAHIFHWSMPDLDGKVIEEVIQEKECD